MNIIIVTGTLFLNFLSQAELADKCNVKQPMIARVEKAVHSPQINSLLKILVPMGYKLEIVPMDKKS
ncbi:MAG: helix-turn-helix transcriptional regulator [Butyrivibrio sp.]|nr:helix-turn-helix transcriptional regulator [Butyrivibrio sp.]